MNIKVYGIGGKWQAGNKGDCPVGTATDPLTFTSLIDLVELKGGYAVSLHGGDISGAYSLADARDILKRVW